MYLIPYLWPVSPTKCCHPTIASPAPGGVLYRLQVGRIHIRHGIWSFPAVTHEEHQRSMKDDLALPCGIRITVASPILWGPPASCPRFLDFFCFSWRDSVSAHRTVWASSIFTLLTFGLSLSQEANHKIGKVNEWSASKR
jgi:hypothetical protein